jgi:23S rRNA pseudouridine2605 synthase
MVDHRKDPNPAADAGQGGDSTEESGSERIAKVLARAGVASRREVERLIEAGRVALNGVKLDTPAVKVGPGDKVTVDGKIVAAAEATRVWRYHKPVGLVTSHNDPMERPTVFAALPSYLPRVISIGRLDLNSEGLLLLTNDGGLSRALEMPTNGWVRRYRVRARGRITQAQLDTLKEGLVYEGVSYGPIDAQLDKAKDGPPGAAQGANLWISVSLTEGKNREVRRVLESLGLTVNRLIRLSYGPFQLGVLAIGEVEEVGPRVIREQLAEFIAPSAMPTGDRPAQIPKSAQNVPGRRPGGAARKGAGGSSAIMDEAKPKAVYKAGWARPKPKPRPTAKPNGPKRRKSGAKAEE